MFEGLDRRGHPFRKLYPFVWRVLSHLPANRQENCRALMRKLHVGEDAKKEEIIFRTKRTTSVLVLMVLVCVLALCVDVCTRDVPVLLGGRPQIARPAYGEGSLQADLSVTVSGEGVRSEEEISVEIPAREYTEEEKEKILGEAKAYLGSVYLGENPSAKEVSLPLRLPKEIEGTPIRVRWTCEDTCISEDGTLQRTGMTQCVETVLRGVLEWDERTEYVEYAVTVLPPELDSAQRGWLELEERLKQALEESRTERKVNLPTRVGAFSVEYREVEAEKKAPMVLLFGGMAAVLCYVLIGQRLKEAVEKRRQQMQMDYPDVLSRCALLLGAGLTIQGSFRKMVEEYRASGTEKRYVYEEMAVAVREMENGVTEAKAVENFGRRSELLSYMKFAGLISQNLKKGSKQLLLLLDNERIEALAERRETAKRLGEQAGTKLLMPMMFMLVTVFVIILIPAFMSF